MDQEHKKFNEAEMLVGGFFTLGVDGVCTLIDLTGVGLAISPIIQGFTTFTMWWWFKSKGDPNASKIGRQITKYLANLLPLIPTTFTAFAIEVYIHNHPERFAALQKIAALKSGAVAAKAAEGGTAKRVLAARQAYSEKMDAFSGDNKIIGSIKPAQGATEKVSEELGMAA